MRFIVENGLNVKKRVLPQRMHKPCIVNGSGETVKNKNLCSVPLFTAWRSPADTLILKESPMIIMPANRLWVLRNYQNVIYENIEVKPD